MSFKIDFRCGNPPLCSSVIAVTNTHSIMCHNVHSIYVCKHSILHVTTCDRASCAYDNVIQLEVGRRSDIACMVDSNKNNNLCNFESKDVLPKKPVNAGP